jgi:hypothetical protein
MPNNEDVYTLEQIEQAFKAEFHKSGETYFPDHGDEERCESATSTAWSLFLETLNQISGKDLEVEVCVCIHGGQFKQGPMDQKTYNANFAGKSLPHDSEIFVAGRLLCSIDEHYTLPHSRDFDLCRTGN